MLGITISTTVSGRLIDKTGRYKIFPVIGLALMTIALALLAAVRGRRSRTSTGIALTLFGLGFGMVTQVLVVAVQNSVERRELGVATATTGFFRALGGAVGAAVLGAVFAAKRRQRCEPDVADGVRSRVPRRRSDRRARAPRRALPRGDAAAGPGEHARRRRAPERRNRDRSAH